MVDKQQKKESKIDIQNSKQNTKNKHYLKQLTKLINNYTKQLKTCSIKKVLKPIRLIPSKLKDWSNKSIFLDPAPSPLVSLFAFLNALFLIVFICLNRLYLTGDLVDELLSFWGVCLCLLLGFMNLEDQGKKKRKKGNFKKVIEI